MYARSVPQPTYDRAMELWETGEYSGGQAVSEALLAEGIVCGRSTIHRWINGTRRQK
jgi:hypothetical protein